MHDKTQIINNCTPFVQYWINDHLVIFEFLFKCELNLIWDNSLLVHLWCVFFKLHCRAEYKIYNLISHMNKKWDQKRSETFPAWKWKKLVGWIFWTEKFLWDCATVHVCCATSSSGYIGSFLFILLFGKHPYLKINDFFIHWKQLLTPPLFFSTMVGSFMG